MVRLLVSYGILILYFEFSVIFSSQLTDSVAHDRLYGRGAAGVNGGLSSPAQGPLTLRPLCNGPVRPAESGAESGDPASAYTPRRPVWWGQLVPPTDTLSAGAPRHVPARPMLRRAAARSLLSPPAAGCHRSRPV